MTIKPNQKRFRTVLYKQKTQTGVRIYKEGAKDHKCIGFGKTLNFYMKLAAPAALQRSLLLLKNKVGKKESNKGLWHAASGWSKIVGGFLSVMHKKCGKVNPSGL